jgi:SNF2 family DNA or RNA helicase
MPLLSEPIVLTREYRQRLSARAVPGAVWDPEAKAWVLVDPSPRAAAVALKMFPDLAAQYPELVERREQLRRGTRPVDNASAAELRIEDSLTLVSPGPMDVVSYYDFQSLDLGYIEAVLEKHGAAYIGWERGLGKTLGAASIIAAMRADRTLIVAPNTAKRSVWEPELRRFLPDHTVVVLPNDKAKREQMLAWIAGREAEGRRLEIPLDPLVLVVHYEALDLVAKLRKDGRGWDRLGEWDLIVADEAHRLKNPKAKMVRAIKKIPTRMKLALSGSIIENHAEELFSPLQWLFPDVYASKWRDWNDRFLDYVDGPFGKLCVGVKEHMLDAMRQELGVFMVYRRKEDELDLPEKTEQMLLVDLTPSQRRAYEDLRDTCVTTLDSGELVAADDGLVMLTRLRQIATGLDLVGEVADSSKLDVALELIEDNEDEAFVVFTWYKAAAYALSDRLSQKNIEHFVVTGDVDHATRADYIDRFQNGEARVFIGTIKTLGESVNLYRATNAIFLDRSWNPMDNAQAADRIYRIGQTQPVTITHLVARDTVDELRVQPALANKEALRRAILGGD